MSAIYCGVPFFLLDYFVLDPPPGQSIFGLGVGAVPEGVRWHEEACPKVRGRDVTGRGGMPSFETAVAENCSHTGLEV